MNSTGIAIGYIPNTSLGLSRVVTLRNLTVRNYARGLEASHSARVFVDHCRFENNQNYGIVLNFGALAVISDTQVTGTGLRTTGAGPNPGHGITLDAGAQARLVNTTVSHNNFWGIHNATGSASNLTFFKVSAYFNGVSNVAGPFTSAPDANFSTN